MRNKKARIKMEQGGKIIEAGTNLADLKVFEIEGLSGLEFDISMINNPNSPNYIINSMKPVSREISLKLFCSGDYRQFLNSFFNPYEKGKLTVTWGLESRWIEYYPQPVSIVQKTIHNNIIAEIRLICPEPYFKDMSDYGKNIAELMPMLAFPFVADINKKIIADYRLLGTEVSLLNKGDVSVGAKVIFKALGDVKNPCVTLNKKEFIKVYTDMSKGDVLTINTDQDDLFVMLNGEDILDKTDPLMTFFQIPKGINLLKYSVDEGSANLQVVVYYTPRYLNI